MSLSGDSDHVILCLRIDPYFRSTPVPVKGEW